MFFVSCVSHVFTSDLLALNSDGYCIFVTIPCGILGQVWYLIVSFPDLCRISYLKSSPRLLMTLIVGETLKTCTCTITPWC